MSLAPPAQQTVGRPAVTSRYRPLTPVFATVAPPRGLSGLVRRIAYRTPDYRARRYALLLIADRIDVFEHRGLRIGVAALALAVGIVGLRALTK
jgi:hypothetical protein